MALTNKLKSWYKRLKKFETLSVLITIITTVLITVGFSLLFQWLFFGFDTPKSPISRPVEKKPPSALDNATTADTAVRQLAHEIEHDSISVLKAVLGEGYRWILLTVLSACLSTVIALLIVHRLIQTDKGKTTLLFRLAVALSKALRFTFVIIAVVVVFTLRDTIRDVSKLKDLQSLAKFDWALVPTLSGVMGLFAGVICGVLCDGITDVLYFRKLVRNYRKVVTQQPAEVPLPASPAGGYRKSLHGSYRKSLSPGATEGTLIASLPDIEAIEHDIVNTLLEVIDYAAYTNRKRDYANYTKVLVDFLGELKQYTEAGNVCRMQAALLEWQPVSFVEQMQAQDVDIFQNREEDPKATLLNQAVQFYTQAKAWELCLDVMSELKAYYRTYFFDVDKYQALQTKEQEITESLFRADRAPPVYYAVIFIGRELHATLQGKMMVYKELPGTKLSSFVNKIKSTFSGIQILDKEPKDFSSVTEPKACYIAGVHPAREAELQGQKLIYPRTWPQNIKTWFQYNNVKIFYKSESFVPEASKSPEKGGDTKNQFANLWTRNRFFVTDSKFPAIRRTALVVRSHETLTHPIDNAITNIAKKNEELGLLLQQATLPEFKSDPKKVSSLTMALTGTLMAGVNGGLDMYRASFLSDDTKKWTKEEKRRLNKLVNVIREHVYITELCLKQQRKIGITPQLQDKLEESLVGLKQRFARELRTTRRLRNFLMALVSLSVVGVAVAIAFVPTPTLVVWLSAAKSLGQSLASSASRYLFS